jgi:hypothetical protein
MSQQTKISILLVFGLLLPAADLQAMAGEPLYSALWGLSGERWSADGRLPDFSYAGYHRGEKSLPLLNPDCSVKDFGAIGDGAPFSRLSSNRLERQFSFPPEPTSLPTFSIFVPRARR